MVTTGEPSVSSIASMWVRRRGNSGQFFVAWPWTSHNVQVGVERGSVVSLATLPSTLFGGGGAGVEIGVVFDGPGGGCDIISMGWMRINMTSGVGGGVGRWRYYIGIPNVKLGKLRVAMIGLLMMLDGGKRKGIICTGKEPQ